MDAEMPDPPPSYLWDLLDRYLAGDATPDEAAMARAYLDRAPGAEALLRQPAAVYLAATQPNATPLPESWDSMQARLEQAGPAVPNRMFRWTPVSRTVSWRSLALRVGAGALAVAAIVFGVRTVALKRAASEAPGQVYVTASGEYARITARDGTRITLAPKSRLTIPATFGENARDVTLNGEAFFDVTTYTAAPFIVHTGRITTRVLGTSFDVRHDSGHVPVRVAVVSGRVVTGGPGTTVTLAAGSVGHVTDSTAIVQATRDLTPYVGWTRGVLQFDSASVSTVLRSIGMWYGYDFKLADSALAAKAITLTVRTGAPQETMRVLEDLLDVTMAFEGSVVTLHPRGSKGPRTLLRRSARDTMFISREVGR